MSDVEEPITRTADTDDLTVAQVKQLKKAKLNVNNPVTGDEIVPHFTPEQTLKQLMKRPHPKAKLSNHYQTDVPLSECEADLLFLPYDRDENDKHNSHMYAFTMIDRASRFKWAVALKSKSSNEVRDALKKVIQSSVYQAHGPIKKLYVDDGSEFKSSFKKYCVDNKIDLIVRPKGSGHNVFVERFNSTLAKLLFEKMSLRELKSKTKDNDWANDLFDVIHDLNHSKTALIKMAPIKAVKMKSVTQPKANHNENDYKLFHRAGTIVRYLLPKDVVATTDDLKITIDRRRATDIKWSRGLYKVVRVLRTCNKCLPMHAIDPIGSTKDDPMMLFNYYEIQPV